MLYSLKIDQRYKIRRDDTYQVLHKYTYWSRAIISERIRIEKSGPDTTTLAPRQHAPAARDNNKPTHEILLHSLTISSF